MHWDDQGRILTIDARRGSYPGMNTRREFSVILVHSGQGTGEAVAAGGRTIEYDGRAQQVHF